MGTLLVLLAAAKNALIAALLLALFSLLGAACIPLVHRPKKAVVAFPVFLACGSALAGWLTWITGHTLGTRVLPILWLGLLAFSTRGFRPWLGALRGFAGRLMRLLRSSLALSVAFLAVGGSILLQLCLPLLDNDGIRYHVAQPKLFLMTGRIFPYTWDVTGSYPQLGNALYLMALAVGSEDTAKFLHAGFLLAATGVLAIALHRGRALRTAALAGPILFWATPLTPIVASAGFIDQIVVFFAATAFLQIQHRGHPALTGVSLGAAISTKLTVGPPAAALGLAAIWLARRGEKVRTLLLTAGFAAAVLAPFAIRNTLYFNDPFYPLGYRALGRPTPGFSAGLFTFLAEFNQHRSGFLGIVWQPREDGDIDECAGIHHLAAVCLLPLALRMPSIRLAAAFALPSLLHASLASPPGRYLLPGFFALSFIGARVISPLMRGRGVWLILPLVLPGTLWAWERNARSFQALRYFRGEMSRSEVLAAVVPGYRAAVFVNSLPPGKVLASDFPGPVYFDRPWLCEGFINESPLTSWARESSSAGELLSRLRQEGIRYILVTPGFGGGTAISMIPFAPEPAKVPLIVALKRQLRKITTIDQVDVLELVPEPAPKPTADPRKPVNPP